MPALTKKKNGDEGEIADIENLFGIALGCIGMSEDDFARCTPAEFNAIVEQWRKREEVKERGEWERNRWLALCVLQPWSKKRPKAQDFCLFPWEIKEQENREEPLDKTERQERYEAAKKRYGIV